jgi:TatD DNase family protein
MEHLIDSHFHLLEMQKKGIDPDKILEAMQSTGFAGGIDIGVEENDLFRRTALLEHYPQIMRAAGIGPWGAQGDEPIGEIVSRFIDHIENLRCDAIGEIGLDYHWNYGTVERQIQLFSDQARLADRMGVPIIIHTRNADSDMMHLLDTLPLKTRGIMHCFSSSWDLAKKALDRGFLISFAGPITYKKNQQLRDTLKKVPTDRLLLETDSPYLSPEPYRGTVNTPLRMVEIYTKTAEIKNLSLEELIITVKENFTRLFSQDDR